MTNLPSLTVLNAWLLGLGAVLGTGALASGLGYVVQLAAVWTGFAS